MTGIMTPSSHAPDVTETYRPDHGTVRRITRHCAYPMDNRAAVHAGTSTASKTPGVAMSEPVSAPPPIPTNHAKPAVATQARPSIAGV